MSERPAPYRTHSTTALDRRAREALNRRLAEHIMGWAPAGENTFRQPNQPLLTYTGEAARKSILTLHFHPTIDHNDAFRVLGQLPYRPQLLFTDGYWTCRLAAADPDCPPHRKHLSAIAATAPLAIALAAEKTIINDP